MCITFFVWKHPQLPDLSLLVAFNRDEVLARPTREAHFWEDLPGILGGRDLVAGGTWLCVSTEGRCSFLTNFRELQSASRQDAPSRGALPVNFVAGQADPEEYLGGLDSEAFPGFNLIAADLRQQRVAYLCNKRGSGLPQPVTPGLHGITNGHMDAHWPKVDEGCRRLQQLIDSGAFAACGSTPSSECAAQRSGGDESDSKRGVTTAAANGASAGSSGTESSTGASSNNRSDGTGCTGSGGGSGSMVVPWDELFSLLSDDRLLETDPERLPQTGFGSEFEAAASGIYMQPIETRWGPFGTRSQTVLAVWQDGRAELRERYLAPDGSWQLACHSFLVQPRSDGNSQQQGGGSQAQQPQQQQCGSQAQQQQPPQQPAGST